MQTHARVVVVGGGCVGAGVLYGLAKRGWSDCVLLEKAQLAGASTRLAGGFIPTYVRSDAASRLINTTIDIYKGLEADTGLSPGWHPCGQMRIARDPVRLDEYRSYMNIAEAIDANAALLSAEEAVALWPLIESKEGILGALYHPDDGYVGPTDVTMAMAKGARDRGAKIYQDTRAIGFSRLPGGSWKVLTTGGDITCDHIVLATGAYARQTGAMLGLDIPAVPVVVQYWFTEPVSELVARKRDGLPEMPIMRDEHFLGYMREEGDGLMFGTYERKDDLQLFGFDGVPDDYNGDPMPADFDAHAWGFERGIEVVPSLGRVGIKENIRGPMQMTADGMPLVGPAYGLTNVWLAEGVPGGILWGGAIGHSLSEWIIEGDTSIDMNELDPRRFGDHATRQWTKLKAVELWGAHSDLILPGEELPAARPAKTAPSYDRLTSEGAVWGAANGWETANWFAPPGVEATDRLGYRSRKDTAYVRDEALAVRTRAGLVEMAGVAKFEVSGANAASFLDRVLATALPTTGMSAGGYQLFERGGVRASYTVVRLDEALFYLVGSPRSERLNFDELWRRLPRDGSVTLRNVTAERGGFSVTGPAARDILRGLAETDLGREAFPQGAVRLANVGLAGDVRLIRTGSTGELGWDLHVPIAYERHLLDCLLDHGAGHSLRLVGQRALNDLRLEKSYAAVGPDLNREISALEGGLETVLAFDKGDFIGGDALSAERGREPSRRLATLSIDIRNGAAPLGHEGVYHEGKLAGRITSGGFSPSFNHGIALALLPPPLCEPGTELKVPLLDTWCAATVLPPSPYDPENLRSQL